MAQKELIALNPEVSTDDAEVFNITEDGSKKKGQLRRYLKILGPILDEARGLVDAFPEMLDVDRTDSDFLAPMGEIVSVNFNRDIPIPQARQEIKQAVQWYKRKGTSVGHRIHGFRITRIQPDIVEFVFNVRTANREFSFSADINDALFTSKFGLPGDQHAYSYDFDRKDIITSISFASASTETTDFEAFRAIDDREGTRWVASGSAPQNLTIDFGLNNEQLIAKIRLKAGRGVKDFILQSSIDGISFFDADRFVNGEERRFTDFLGNATTGPDAFATNRTPLSAPPDPAVYEVTGFGAGDTTLAVAAAPGDTNISIANTGGFAVGDFIQLIQASVGTGYFQISKIEGNLFLLTTEIGTSASFPSGLTTVKNVAVTLKTAVTDYTIDLNTGAVTLLAGQFTSGQDVFIDYEGLADKDSIEIWTEHILEVERLVARRFWRILIESTWGGVNPSIIELELFPDQFFGRFYRPDRVGFFFLLEEGKPLLQQTVTKLCNTMPEVMPVCCVPVFIFRSADLEEYSPTAQVIEEFFDQ